MKRVMMKMTPMPAMTPIAMVIVEALPVKPGSSVVIQQEKVQMNSDLMALHITTDLLVTADMLFSVSIVSTVNCTSAVTSVFTTKQV